MVSLIDLAPIKETVPVRGQQVTVTGVSALGIAHLLRNFQELRALIVGREVAITPELLMDVAPRAVAAIIAAGTGSPGHCTAEEIAEALPVSDQLNLLAAIIKVTIPEGIDPLVEKLGKLMAGLGVSDDGGKVQATSSPKRSKSS